MQYCPLHACASRPACGARRRVTCQGAAVVALALLRRADYPVSPAAGLRQPLPASPCSTDPTDLALMDASLCASAQGGALRAPKRQERNEPKPPRSTTDASSPQDPRKPRRQIAALSGSHSQSEAARQSPSDLLSARRLTRRDRSRSPPSHEYRESPLKR